jgi:hypothetical protein
VADAPGQRRGDLRHRKIGNEKIITLPDEPDEGRTPGFFEVELQERARVAVERAG